MLPKHLRWTTENQVPVGTASVRALTKEQIQVVFQPIIEVATGQLFAHEVLARCTVPEFKSPMVLFEQASAEQVCGRLGRIIRDQAFEACPNLPLFVNIHPDELSSRWLVRPDDPIGFHSEQVYLEITETAAFTHFDLCNGVLRELCARTSARLVIDDFGAGHSNLQRLLELEPAIVKLDISLVHGIEASPRKQIIVRHISAMCHDLGAQVVAEGVETEPELTSLLGLGIDLVQGYLLARPAYPPPQFYWPHAAGSAQVRRQKPPPPPSAHLRKAAPK